MYLCKRERESVCMFVCERKKVCVCVTLRLTVIDRGDISFSGASFLGANHLRLIAKLSLIPNYVHATICFVTAIVSTD